MQNTANDPPATQPHTHAFMSLLQSVEYKNYYIYILAVSKTKFCRLPEDDPRGSKQVTLINTETQLC
jgi:hypothetical protein